MLENLSHPMYHSLEALGSSFSARLLHPQCEKERSCRSFLPAAVRQYNIHCPPCTVRDDSSSAAAQCSVGHPPVFQQWSQDAAHRTLPTGRCPKDAAHRTLPTGRCPEDAAHRTLLTGRCPQDAAQRMLLAGYFWLVDDSQSSSDTDVSSSTGTVELQNPVWFKTLMLAYKAKNGPAPPYLMAVVKSRAVEPPSLRTHGRQASRLFSVLAPRWWNELPLGVRTVESLAVFKRRLKTRLFVMRLSTSTGPLFGQCLSSWHHDISSWMTAHHLKLNPSKTELLFLPSTTGPHCDLAISLGNSLIAPTEDARSLGVILDGQLSFSAHIANLTRSCRFLLYNIRRIRPFLSQEATQLLVQSLVISRLDYCNSLLAGLPLRAIRPLQLVQNAAARLIFNLPKFTHVTPLLCSLHWLPVVAHIRFKTLMLAYKAKNGPAPPYLMAMVKSRAVPRALRASSTARLEPPSLRTHGRQASRLFSVLAPRWWNELPLGVRTAESLAVFKRRLKTHLFVKHLSGNQE
ncbi:hypothetical protein NFI96_004734 [Prochilodus magdalenae]|nr:hypothetical protein NFI96_004734 [Prochilodus magdalenae]